MIYTYTDYQNAVQDLSHGNRANLKQERPLLNRAVREVLGRVDLRSSKRRAALSPFLFEQEYHYTKPTDMKGLSIIDLKAQHGRASGYKGEFTLTTPEEFDRNKRTFRNLLAVEDFDGIGQLLISAITDSEKTLIHNMDSLTANGTWDEVAASGAENINSDANNYVEGSASVSFDVDTTGTVPAIENASGMEAVDLSDYVGQDILVRINIPSAGLSKVTNVILRWGSSSGNYHSRTVTTASDAGAFRAGINILRFPWDTSVADTGTPVDTAIDYLRVTVTLSGVYTIPVKDFWVDYIVAMRGVAHDVHYYSKYLWQNSSGTYIENSTADTDLLNVDTEEFDLICARADWLLARAQKSPASEIKENREAYNEAEGNYILKYPSEVKTLITTYYELDSMKDDLILDS
jgi:hypothetical protein